jgi:hypothetical protein
MNTDSIKLRLEEETGQKLSFFEYRVGLVITDMTGKNYQKCSDEDFYNKAAQQGTIFTLKGFERFIYSGALTELMNSVQHPNYLLPRFMPVFEDEDFRIYVDTEELKENRYAEY